jgi:hypothetical protein
MVGTDIPDELPEEWIEDVELLVGAEVPTSMSEERLPRTAVDEDAASVAAAALREAVRPDTLQEAP